MIIQPTLFSPVIQYIYLANAENIIMEVEDNFQKQTYRNRYVIYGANGKHVLTVPIIHTNKIGRIKTKEIRIDYQTPWQKLHIRSLQSAYRSSPFYEFYEDEILSLFNKKHQYLIDLIMDSLKIIGDCLQEDFKYQLSKEYQPNTDKDFRFLANAKSNQKFDLQEYTQVFDDKHGFIPNLSILDLLFNEGPNTMMYLEAHKDLLFKS